MEVLFSTTSSKCMSSSASFKMSFPPYELILALQSLASVNNCSVHCMLFSCRSSWGRSVPNGEGCHFLIHDVCPRNTAVDEPVDLASVVSIYAFIVLVYSLLHFILSRKSMIYGKCQFSLAHPPFPRPVKPQPSLLKDRAIPSRLLFLLTHCLSSFPLLVSFALRNSPYCGGRTNRLAVERDLSERGDVGLRKERPLVRGPRAAGHDAERGVAQRSERIGSGEDNEGTPGDGSVLDCLFRDPNSARSR